MYHNSLPKYLSDDLERLQKRALRIILSEKTYAAALESTGLTMMHDRRQTLTERLFSYIVSNKDHALHSLLPKVNCARPLRSNRCFNVPICKTNRFKNSFIMCNSNPNPNASKVNSFYIVNSFLFSIIVFYRNSILLNCKIFVFVKSTVIQPMAANFRLLINHLHLLTYLRRWSNLKMIKRSKTFIFYKVSFFFI